MAKRRSQMVYVGSKSQLDRIGEVLKNDDGNKGEFEKALEILNKWRASHNFPLHTFQWSLRRKVNKFGKNAFVAQRLKRTPTILDKLKRQKDMNLSRMQDIGGCRAVLPTVENVRDVRNNFINSRIRHKIVRDYDYIAKPKPSGYRGIHLIYRYESDRFTDFNGYQIEIQIRTQLQHLWATAVETVGTFIQFSLKSSQGPEEWLKFFKNVSSYFASLENSPPVPGTPGGEELLAQIRNAAKELKVRERLTAFGNVLLTIENVSRKKVGYYLLILRPSAKTLRVRPFGTMEEELATREYLEAEREFRGSSDGQVVLVKADSLEGLRKAYPNYYLDTNNFLEILAKIDA